MVTTERDDLSASLDAGTARAAGPTTFYSRQRHSSPGVARQPPDTRLRSSVSLDMHERRPCEATNAYMVRGVEASCMLMHLTIVMKIIMIMMI